MNRRISMTLDVSSINKAIKQLKTYTDNTLPRKMKELVNALADIGIEVAYSNMGQYDGYVEFRKEFNEVIGGCKAIMIGADLSPVLARWQGDDGGYEVSPIALSEFGSGWLADVKFESMDGIVGQGTMPNAKGHAFDPMGWEWREYQEPHTYHRSIGYEPTHPLYKAWIEMKQDINNVALKVFGKR